MSACLCVQTPDLLDFLRHSGRDPSHLVFEDELTGVHNRRFLHSYLEHKVRWEGDSDFPLSLLMLDLDRFKEVNDGHGHAVGDEALAWVASVIQEVAGESGLPVRFGGDEFVVLLPATAAEAARETAARLLQRLRERPFRLRESGTTVPVSVSIGVVTAPADANTGRDLLHAADMALYHAKQTGRDRAATAAEVDPHKVFPHIALHRLLVTGIAGRETELRAVAETLVALGRGENQHVVFEGAAGMGKTTLLAAIGRSLSGHGTFAIARVAGDPQEAFRPYYLTTRIIGALLNQRADKGASLIEGWSEEEIAHLSHLVPHVGTGATPLATGDERAQRRSIFNTLARVIPRLVDRRPLVLLIDDLQFADEATLVLLRALIESDQLQLCVCGATLAPARDAEPGVQRLKLAPLTAAHVVEYLRGVFPTLRMPPGFEAALVDVTQGNPLFLVEIVHQLVTDRKVTLVGSEWVIEPLAAENLPRSLEEILETKMAALNADGRQLLEHASALGEAVPVSTLTGSSALDENRVFEFVDQAEALGLVSTAFEHDDDVMHFRGKRVLNASYQGMDEGRRAALHGRIGAYQEALHRQRLSSASRLEHHFTQAGNPGKAARYEQARLANDRSVFDADEAARYSVELLEEEENAEAPLAPETLALVPRVIRAFMTAARSVQLYPAGDKKTQLAIAQLRQALEAILVSTPALQLMRDHQRLRANGRSVDVSEWSALATSFRGLLHRLELQGVTFQPGITDSELKDLLTACASTKPGAVAPGFWKRLATERGLKHLRPDQERYAQIVRTKAGALVAASEEVELGPSELAELPKLVHAFKSAARIVKLYPVDAEPATVAMEQLHTAVRAVLRTRASLTLAGVGEELLVNGVRIDTTGYEPAARHVVKLLGAAGLESVTFLAGVPKAELTALLVALRDIPASPDHHFWDAFAKRLELSGLALNQRHYAATAVRGLLGAKALDDAEATPGVRAESPPALQQGPPEFGKELLVAGEAAPGARAAAVERLVAEALPALQQALPEFGKELLVAGEDALVRGLLARLFQRFTQQDTAARTRSVQACRALFDQVIFGLQHTFAKLAVEDLLSALATETMPPVLRELGDLLRAMAASSVHFADYQLASRLLLALGNRTRQLHNAGGQAAAAAPTLDGRLDSVALRLLYEDVRSQQPERQEAAVKVLGALGSVAVPVLVGIAKGESDFRVRQLAARLLAEAGPVGAEQIKRALITEVIVEQRARLLEVIDTVTQDLWPELQQCLSDSSPRVRREAFQLFERLRRDDLIDLILPFARDGHPAVARAAIRALAPMHTPASVDALCSILRATDDARLAALCCRALGRAAHPAAIDALAGVLKARRFRFFGRRWRSEVRATAAAALKQIPHLRAAAVLAEFARDADAVVRQMATGEGAPEIAVDVEDEADDLDLGGPPGRTTAAA